MNVNINWTAWVGSVLLMAFLPVLASIPPWVSEPIRFALMWAFDPFCHQIADRSPHINGVQLAVCHRCYGILTGLALGPVAALIFRSWNKKNAHMLILISGIPLIVDWGLGVLNAWDGTAETRLITGLFFGVAAGFLVTSAMSLYSSNKFG